MCACGILSYRHLPVMDNNLGFNGVRCRVVPLFMFQFIEETGGIPNMVQVLPVRSHVGPHQWFHMKVILVQCHVCLSKYIG